MDYLFIFRILSCFSALLRNKLWIQENMPQYSVKMAQSPSKYPTDHTKTKRSQDFKFLCDLCGKKFARKNDYKSHQLVHTDERLFKCKFCDVKFKRKSNLNKHFKSQKHQINLQKHLENKKQFVQK